MEKVSGIYGKLNNSSVGLGAEWRAMEREVMAYNLRTAGLFGFVLLGIDQALALLPGSVGDRAASRMMARVWRNYFDPPESAPLPSEEWLNGVRSRPIFATRRAALSATSNEIRNGGFVDTLIIFGERDIYGNTTEYLSARFPNARTVVLPGAGHVPWIQEPAAFSKLIVEFFAI